MGTHGVVATVLDPHHGQIRCVRVETVELLRQGIGIAHPPDDQRRYLHPKRGGCGWRAKTGEEMGEGAYFRDSYRAPLSRGELGIVDVFFGISPIISCG